MGQSTTEIKKPIKNERILIIKTGWSEVLHEEPRSRQTSLGDVIRTTVLLHLYKNCYVTWITDERAVPLLKDNPYIADLIAINKYGFVDPLVVEELRCRIFDTVVNLEKDPGLCALVNSINAWKKFGFRFDQESGRVSAFEKSLNVLTLCIDKEMKKQNRKTAQELLYEIVDAVWNGEEYILGYNPTTREKYDVGFNSIVGQKWLSKSWATKNWDDLEHMLYKLGVSVSRQEKQHGEVLTDIYKYIDWLNSCRIIVSNDSLGLHLGIVLKKKVLGLFGPTSSHEIYFYGRGKALLPPIQAECIPCFESKCKYEKSCVDHITPEQVCEEIKGLLK